MSEIQVGQINSTDGSTAITTGAGGTVELSAACAALTGTDATLSGGVYLGGTGAANYLDDYEEGTFTVTNASDSTGVISSEDGFYIKIGSMVFVRIIFVVSTNFTSGQIGGLPFNVKDQSGVSAYGWNGVSVDASADMIVANAEEDTTLVNLFENGQTSSGHAPNTAEDSYRISLMYQTD